MSTYLALCKCGQRVYTIEQFNTHSLSPSRNHSWVDVPDVLVVHYPKGWKPPPKRKRIRVCRSCSAPYDCKAMKRCHRREGL